MQNLYERIDTNTLETNNTVTKKVDLLFDMNNDKYCIQDIEYSKKLICVSGTCDLKLEKDNLVESITLNNPNEIIKIDKNVTVEISNFTKQTKIAISYIEA